MLEKFQIKYVHVDNWIRSKTSLEFFKIRNEIWIKIQRTNLVDFEI
jgi:hypothetical protein